MPMVAVSGLRLQDNDIILLDSPEAVAAFTLKFEALFSAGIEKLGASRPPQWMDSLAKNIGPGRWILAFACW
jgi:hypothetical protein